MADKSSSKVGEGRRRSERVLLRIPIEVKGTGADAKPFTEKTFTLVVNGDGARISLKAKLRQGDQLTITNLQTKISCPFRVVHRTTDLLGEGPPEWGVECLEPEVNFWGIVFPKKAADTAKQELIDALLECSKCNFRELAQLALEQYRALVSQSSLTRNCTKCGAETEWGFGFVEAGPEEAIPSQAAPSAEPSSSGGGAERRRAKRVTVKLPVRIRLEDGREEIARTENLSKTGVCFASDIVMREGEVVQLTVGYTPGHNEAAIPARVVWRRSIEGSNRALYGVHLEEVD
jgi:PilZ domain-containing protein